MTNRRDSKIELYRCLLTLGIVILHVIGCYGQEWHWLSSAFVWCVPGFVFITGYFGLKFSILKIVKLYGICLWCFPVSMLMGQIVSGGLELKGWLILSWKAFLGNWFVHAYIGLMMLAPIVDCALDKVRDSQKCIAVFVPFLFFVFVWSFLSNYNCAKMIIPEAPSCSVLTLLGIYVVARIYRIYELAHKVSIGGAIALFAVCVALATLRIGKFNSLISIGIVIGSFVLVRSLKMPSWFSAIVLWAGPSMFSIFLIHANKWIFSAMHGYVDGAANILGLYTPIAFLAVSIAIFLASLALDIPRRLALAWFLKKRA